MTGTRIRLLIGVVLSLLVISSAFSPVGALPDPLAFPLAQVLFSLSEIILQPGVGEDDLLLDACILEWHADENKGVDGALQVQPPTGVIHTLMRWNLPSSLDGAQIQEARLELYSFYRTREWQIDISVYRVLVPWDERSVTWNEASEGVAWDSPGCSGLGGDREGMPVTVTSITPEDPTHTWYTWDITPLVQGWVDDPTGNQGLILIGSGNRTRYDFFSSEASSTFFRPRLVVQYNEIPTTETPTLTPEQPTATPTDVNTPTITPTVTKTTGPSPTPTETPTSWIDVSKAVPACCLEAPGCQFEGDTSGKPNNAQYYGDVPWPYTGPEDVYIFHKTVVSDLTANLESLSLVDLDVFLLYDAYPSAYLIHGDTGFTYRNLAPGTYYVVVDGYGGAMGSYRLSLICAGEPVPTATITPRPTPTNTPVYSYYPILFRKPTPTPTCTPTLTNTPTPTVTPTFQAYNFAVNCGGTEWYLHTDGTWYSPDKPYEAGSWGWEGGQHDFIYPPLGDGVSPISNTLDDPIYQRHRYAMDAYRFTVPSGSYEVLLHFAETFDLLHVGDRVFAVDIEGRRVEDGFDMLAKGARLRAWDGAYYNIVVKDGLLDITFDYQSSSGFAPAINAIRIHRSG